MSQSLRGRDSMTKMNFNGSLSMSKAGSMKSLLDEEEVTRTLTSDALNLELMKSGICVGGNTSEHRQLLSANTAPGGMFRSVQSAKERGGRMKGAGDHGSLPPLTPLSA